MRRSTKKLTEFSEFALTPTIKERDGGPIFCANSMISPLRLAKLEKRHGISLRKGSSIESIKESGQETNLFAISEKD